VTRDFTTCGWTRPESNGARYCKLKKTFLTEADRGIGICPCFSWVKRKEVKNGEASKKKGEEETSLFGKPEKET